MMTYRGKGLTLEQVAKELGCSHVLEGWSGARAIMFA